MAGEPVLLFDVAERLFASPVLEEKALAVTMLEPSLRRFGDAEFRRFEAWLGAVVSWADHDALAMCLIGPMLVADPRRVRRPLRWAASPSRWRRRAAAVSLIHGIRRGRFEREAVAVTERLLADGDDMVQKGLGWLLREWAKHDPEAALPVLMDIRGRASRLVLRTACESSHRASRTGARRAGIRDSGLGIREPSAKAPLRGARQRGEPCEHQGPRRVGPRTGPIIVSSQNAAQGPRTTWGVWAPRAADSTLELRFAGLAVSGTKRGGPGYSAARRAVCQHAPLTAAARAIPSPDHVVFVTFFSPRG